MPKIKYRDLIEGAEEVKLSNKNFYETKYYGLFLNAYRFPQLTEQQSHYLLKLFWRNGTASAFIVEGSKPDASMKELLSNSGADTLSVGEENPNGLIVFTPYATSQFNAQDFPSVVNLVNVRGANFIPQRPMIVNKDVVIGYAHTSHASVRNLVLFYINKIVEVEKTIETNLFVHKLPRLIVVSPNDRKRVEDIVQAIERGEHKLFLDSEDYLAIKNVLEAGGNYIIDKLYQYKQSLENELLSFLGIDNIGIEKRERLITDEANANNDLINDSSDCFLDSLKSFCKNVSEKLGFPLSVISTSSPVVSESNNNEKETDEEKEDSNNENN